MMSASPPRSHEGSSDHVHSAEQPEEQSLTISNDHLDDLTPAQHPRMSPESDDAVMQGITDFHKLIGGSGLPIPTGGQDLPSSMRAGSLPAPGVNSDLEVVDSHGAFSTPLPGLSAEDVASPLFETQLMDLDTAEDLRAVSSLINPQGADGYIENPTVIEEDIASANGNSVDSAMDCSHGELQLTEGEASSATEVSEELPGDGRIPSPAPQAELDQPQVNLGTSMLGPKNPASKINPLLRKVREFIMQKSQGKESVTTVAPAPDGMPKSSMGPPKPREVTKAPPPPKPQTDAAAAAFAAKKRQYKKDQKAGMIDMEAEIIFMRLQSE